MQRRSLPWAAARRKGKWTGGCPPLGYDVASGGGKLVVNEDEAEQVRAIFALYLEHRSLLHVVELLNARGWRTKSWLTQSGKRHEGARWEKAALRKLLTNVVYIGKVAHKGEVLDGEHPGIMEPEVFGRAAEALKGGKRDAARGGNKHGFLLRGLVHCSACRSVMTSTFSSPRGKPYRYYSCTAPRRRGTGECPVRNVSAAQLEDFVVARIRDIGRDPALLEETLVAIEADREREKPQLEKEQRMLTADLAGCRGEARKLVTALAGGGNTPSLTDRLAELDERAGQLEARLAEVAAALEAVDHQAFSRNEVAKALADFDPVWDALVPKEKATLLALLIERVEYDGTDVMMLAPEIQEGLLFGDVRTGMRELLAISGGSFASAGPMRFVGEVRLARPLMACAATRSASQARRRSSSY